jgi:hypothetical protein
VGASRCRQGTVRLLQVYGSLMVRSSVLGACLVAMVMSAPAANAKGPAQGIVRGKAIHPVRLNQPRTGLIGPMLGSMVEATRFLDQLRGGHWPPDRPTGRLGVRYTITYRMDVNRTGADRVRQFFFPYARAGPSVRMPAGQRYWGNDSTVGGWYVGGPSLKRLAIVLDLPTATGSRSR